MGLSAGHEWRHEMEETVPGLVRFVQLPIPDNGLEFLLLAKYYLCDCLASPEWGCMLTR